MPSASWVPEHDVHRYRLDHHARSNHDTHGVEEDNGVYAHEWTRLPRPDVEENAVRESAHILWADSTPYCSCRKAPMSRVDMPRAYVAMILSSKPLT